VEIDAYTVDDPLIDATRADGTPRMRITRPNAPAVVLGRGSKPERELLTDACALDGVPVLRRRGGGCAVVLDAGNVIVSAVLPVEGIGDNRRHFATISDWLIGGLTRLGIDGVRQDGISDLVLAQRKVGGSCIYRTKGLLYYSASLLAEPRLELMERYLAHPPREPDYRGGRSHRDFVGRMADVTPRASASTLEQGLREELDLAALGWDRRPKKKEDAP
jgi:lipoate-protein ligase A